MKLPYLRYAFLSTALLLALILTACAPAVTDTGQISRSRTSDFSVSDMDGLMTDIDSIQRGLVGMMDGEVEPERLQGMMSQTSDLMQQMAPPIRNDDAGGDSLMLMQESGQVLTMMQDLANMMSGLGGMEGLMGEMNTLQQDYEFMSRQNQFDSQGLGVMMEQLGGMMNQVGGLLPRDGMMGGGMGGSGMSGGGMMSR